MAWTLEQLTRIYFPQLYQETSMKFKVGDKIQSRRYGYVDTVRSIGDQKVYYTSGSFDWISDMGKFDLVASAEAEQPESELERLVRVANDGRVAIEEIHVRFPGQVTFIKDWGAEQFSLALGHKHTPGSRFEVKPKSRPLPAPIYVGTPETEYELATQSGPWKVELSADRKTVTVGCQRFDSKALKDSLTQVCRQEKTVYSCNNISLHASKSGVMHEGYKLSWADADRLLAFLEEGLKDA